MTKFLMFFPDLVSQMQPQCFTSAHDSFLSQNIQLIIYCHHISRRYAVPDTDSVVKHTTNKLIDTQRHPQMAGNSYPTNSARLLLSTFSLNLLPLPQTLEA
jgi:hypothetical protein